MLVLVELTEVSMISEHEVAEVEALWQVKLLF